MTRLALAIDEAAVADGCVVDAPTARALFDGLREDVLLLRADALSTGFLGVARVAALEPISEGGGYRATLSSVRRFEPELPFVTSLGMAPPLQLLDQWQFDEILAKATTLPRAEAALLTGLGEAATGFAVGTPDLATFEAVVQTLRREMGGRCAATGEALPAGTVPVVIFPKGAEAGLHVNNLLLLSPDAEAAFNAGHLSVRDDFAVLVDLERIDPELLERINPLGRLLVPANPALRPAPENLAWHRRMVFRLR